MSRKCGQTFGFRLCSPEGRNFGLNGRLRAPPPEDSPESLSFRAHQNLQVLARYPKNGLTGGVGGIGSRPDEDGFDPYCCSCCCNVNRGNGGQCLDERVCNGRNRRILTRMIQLRPRKARTTPRYVGPESQDLIQTRRGLIGIAKRRGK